MVPKDKWASNDLSTLSNIYLRIQLVPYYMHGTINMWSSIIAEQDHHCPKINRMNLLCCLFALITSFAAQHPKHTDAAYHQNQYYPNPQPARAPTVCSNISILWVPHCAILGPQLSNNVPIATGKYWTGLFAKCVQRRLLLDAIICGQYSIEKETSQAMHLRLCSFDCVYGSLPLPNKHLPQKHSNFTFRLHK